MLRHDAFGNLDVMAEKESTQAIPGMQFPLPVVGPYSPSVLTLRLLLKASLVFGSYLLVLRLVCLVNPELACFGANVLSAVFATALVIQWFAPERGMPEWPVWVGAGLLVVFGASSIFPGLGLLSEVPGQGTLTSLIPALLQAGIAVLILVHFLVPAIKRTTSKYSRGPLLLGLIAAYEGGKFATASYFPESDFSAWTLFACMVLFTVPPSMVVADQYARFQEAMNRSWDGRERPGAGKRVQENFFKYGVSAPYALAAALWFGNLVFLGNLGSNAASFTGFHAFLGCLALWGWLREFGEPLRPYRAAWAALSFFLTYNLQRVSNSNVFQLRRFIREPLVRLAIVGSTSAFLSLGLLHLSGVQAAPGRNEPRPNQLVFWNYVLPQSYPELFREKQLGEPATGIYHRYSEKLVTEGDAALPTATPVRSLAGLAVRGLLFIVGGPLLFFFIFATTQGHFLASKEERPEGS